MLTKGGGGGEVREEQKWGMAKEKIRERDILSKNRAHGGRPFGEGKQKGETGVKKGLGLLQTRC